MRGPASSLLLTTILAAMGLGAVTLIAREVRGVTSLATSALAAEEARPQRRTFAGEQARQDRATLAHRPPRAPRQYR